MASSIKSNRQVNLPMTIIVESWNLQVYFDWGSHSRIKMFHRAEEFLLKDTFSHDAVISSRCYESCSDLGFVVD